MPHKAKQDHYEELAQVVTLAEAARMSYRHPNSVKYAIDAGNVAATKCGRVWLVSVRSLKAHWPEVAI